MTESLTIVLLSIVPVSELRGALIYAATQGISLSEALPIAILANIVIAVIIFPYINPLYTFCKTHLPFVGRIGDKVFRHTQTKHSHKFERFKAFALLLLVAVPLPGTGAWTGMAVAFVFDVPMRIALTMISIGVVIAGLIMTILIRLGYWIF